VQRRTLHADELGRARDIAAETVDLRQQVLALEDLARLAQRQRHQVLRAAVHGERHVGADLLGEHVGGDDRVGVAAGEDHQPLDVVSELAHVAGPVMRLQHSDGVLADAARSKA
jgi:hypothetical protein